MSKYVVIGAVLVLGGLSLAVALSNIGEADVTERSWLNPATDFTLPATVNTGGGSGYLVFTQYVRPVNASDNVTLIWKSGTTTNYFGIIILATFPAAGYSNFTEAEGKTGYGGTTSTYQFMYGITFTSTSTKSAWIRFSSNDVIRIDGYCGGYSSITAITLNYTLDDSSSPALKLNNNIAQLNNNITQLNNTIATLNSSLTSSLNALYSTMNLLNTTLTNAIYATNTLLDSINSSLTYAINETNAFLNYINSTFTNDINAVNSTLNTNLSSLWTSYTNLMENITCLNGQYNALQEIINNLTLSNNTITVYQNNTILAQWDAINATLANISSLQTRMINVENNKASSYNDTAIHKQLDALQNQVNNTKPITEIQYQNSTAPDDVAKMLGVTGIIIGFVGVGVAALALRRKKKEEPIPETSPTEAQSAVPPIAMQYTPIIKEEPTTPPAINAPEEQIPTTIEDVFLLYNDGRLLSHQTRRLKPGVDDAILGGMLTAVQSFIQESFSGDDEGAIKTLEYGSMKIIIERHEQVYLATVMSGDEPKNLRKDMRHLLMDIWDSHKEILSKWDGDTNKLKRINGLIKQFIKGT